MAHQRLGIMYREGQGVKQNSKKAIAHLKRSLEQGNSNAQKSLTVTYAKEAREGDAESQNILGSMYYHGKGVKQSYEQAFDWFQMAAEQGHAGAQYQLGWIYNDGKGVKQNSKKARAWLNKAKQQGYEGDRIW